MRGDAAGLIPEVESMEWERIYSEIDAHPGDTTMLDLICIPLENTQVGVRQRFNSSGLGIATYRQDDHTAPYRRKHLTDYARRYGYRCHWHQGRRFTTVHAHGAGSCATGQR